MNLAATPLYTITDLGALGGNVTIANSINDSGQITGQSYNADFCPRAFLSANGTLTDLGVASGALESHGLSISENGKIAGWVYSGGSSQAVVWEAGIWINVAGGNSSAAYGISPNGQYAGGY